jgi:hypothetical protein
VKLAQEIGGVTRVSHLGTAGALGYLIATWAPVSSADAELAAMVCRDSEQHAA